MLFVSFLRWRFIEDVSSQGRMPQMETLIALFPCLKQLAILIRLFAISSGESWYKLLVPHNIIIFLKDEKQRKSLDINKNVTLAHVKQHLKIVLGIIKGRSTTLNIKMTRNYQKNFGKSKNAMEHQKLHGKLSQFVTLKVILN